AKLLEFNADTPTSLYESAVFQWNWLEVMKQRGKLAADADQFNSIHDRLVEAFAHIGKSSPAIQFAAVLENDEDRLTLEYMADCAVQAGCEVATLDMTRIGVDGDDWLVDENDLRMATMFKLYPLEEMVRQDFGVK